MRASRTPASIPASAPTPTAWTSSPRCALPGRLAPGAKADLLVFDLWKPHLQPVRDPLKNLVWKGHAGDLALVMVHGKPVVRDGRLLTADEDAIMRTAAVAARKIWRIAEQRQILPAA
jgi:5-methylthioadenosine/S-adenosylhomocysteine deaminase